MKMIELPEAIQIKLKNSPETGMGYFVGDIILNNGECIKQVAVVDGKIVKAKGYFELNFKKDDINEFIITHEKWQFNKP
jgi:hypothetical protein